MLSREDFFKNIDKLHRLMRGGKFGEFTKVLQAVIQMSRMMKKKESVGNMYSTGAAVQTTNPTEAA